MDEQNEQAILLEDAINRDNLRSVERFQTNGFDMGRAPEKTDPSSGYVMYTPLSLALVDGNTDIVDYLIRQKIDLNATNSDGSTALFAAMGYKGGYRLVGTQLLLEHGANVNATFNDHGALITTINSARLLDDSELIKLLLKSGAQDPFRLAVIRFPMGRTAGDGRRQIIYGIGYGGDVTNRLVIAAGNNESEHVLALLNAGGDVNAKEGNDLFRISPLGIAVLRGYTNLIAYLVAHGANVNIRNQNGTTPLMLAVGGLQSSADIARLLMDHGADVSLKDSAGYSAMDYAELSGNTNLLILLQGDRRNNRLRP
jgi:ankyrin repeat protein